jgi:hypothetical protein
MGYRKVENKAIEPTPSQNLQRLVVRMLYDIEFSRKILSSEQAIKRLNLSLPDQAWQWLKQNHQLAYHADAFRSHRTLEALICYLPFSFTVYLSFIPKHQILDFFQSPFFHEGIQHRELLILSLKKYLLADFQGRKLKPIVWERLKKIIELEYWMAYFKIIQPASDIDQTLQKQAIDLISQLSLNTTITSLQSLSQEIQQQALFENQLFTLTNDYMLMSIDTQVYEYYLRFLSFIEKQEGSLLEKLLHGTSLIQILLSHSDVLSGQSLSIQGQGKKQSEAKHTQKSKRTTNRQQPAQSYLKISHIDIEELPTALYQVLMLAKHRVSPMNFMSLMGEMDLEVKELLALLQEWLSDGLLRAVIKT